MTVAPYAGGVKFPRRATLRHFPRADRYHGRRQAGTQSRASPRDRMILRLPVRVQGQAFYRVYALVRHTAAAPDQFLGLV
jgi:hypothetical protein